MSNTFIKQNYRFTCVISCLHTNLGRHVQIFRRVQVSNMQLQSHGKLFPSQKDFHARSNWSRKTNGAYVFTQPSSTRCLLHVWRAWRCQLLGTGSNQVQQQMPSTIPTNCVFTCHWENVTQFEYLYALWWSNRVLWLGVFDWKQAEQIQNAHLFIWRQKKVAQTLQFTVWQERIEIPF